MKPNLSTKKLREIDCVKKFLKNSSISFKDCEIIPNSEENSIVDVFWGNKKFQIVYADFEFQKLMNITPKDENGVRWITRERKPEDVFNDFFKNPIEKKNKYGDSAKGFILLIDSYTIPPWLENQVEIFKESSNDYLENLGFYEIYIVYPGKNIKVYP